MLSLLTPTTLQFLSKMLSPSFTSLVKRVGTHFFTFLQDRLALVLQLIIFSLGLLYYLHQSILTIMFETGKVSEIFPLEFSCLSKIVKNTKLTFTNVPFRHDLASVFQIG